MRLRWETLTTQAKTINSLTPVLSHSVYVCLCFCVFSFRSVAKQINQQFWFHATDPADRYVADSKAYTILRRNVPRRNCYIDDSGLAFVSQPIDERLVWN